MEVPGGKREFHGPGDYKGKRVTVEVEPLGKLDPPSFNSLATPQEFAEQIADQVRKANQGANATVSKAGERDQGRCVPLAPIARCRGLASPLPPRPARLPRR